MRTKIVEKCVRICMDVILNPKYKYELSYVIEALEQEKRKNKLRVKGIEMKKNIRLEKK